VVQRDFVAAAACLAEAHLSGCYCIIIVYSFRSIFNVCGSSEAGLLNDDNFGFVLSFHLNRIVLILVD